MCPSLDLSCCLLLFSCSCSLQNIPGLQSPEWSRVGGATDELHEELEERAAEQRWKEQKQKGKRTVQVKEGRNRKKERTTETNSLRAHRLLSVSMDFLVCSTLLLQLTQLHLTTAIYSCSHAA
jgi:hypothetical protein